jgi:hypothetical protein
MALDEDSAENAPPVPDQGSGPWRPTVRRLTSDLGRGLTMAS